jgi:hypothetical protein
MMNNTRNTFFAPSNQNPYVEQTAEATSVMSFWGFLIDVAYELKHGGEYMVRYYLTRLPTANPKTLAWSNFRHEMKMFAARDRDAALLHGWKCGNTRDDSFITSTLPIMKNAEIKRARIQLMRFEPQTELALEVKVTTPPVPSVKKKAKATPVVKVA